MELKLKELTVFTEIFHAYLVYMDCMYLPSEKKFQDKVYAWLNNSNVRIFAGFYEEKIVGLMVVSLEKYPSAELIGISVDRNYRKCGIGSWMIGQLKNACNISMVHAETDDDAVEFYRKNRFKITAFNRTFDNTSVLRYRCCLNYL